MTNLLFRQLYGGLWLVWLAYWLLNWSGNKRTIQISGRRRRLLSFIFLVGLLFAFDSDTIKRWIDFHAAIIPENALLRGLGVALAVAGIAITFWARYTLGTNWSAAPTIKEGHELITRGPYHFARHPIYTGILLALFGAVVGGGEVRDIVLLVVLAVALHFKSRVEEKFMLQTFPEAYPQYMKTTKAIIPFVL